MTAQVAPSTPVGATVRDVWRVSRWPLAFLAMLLAVIVVYGLQQGSLARGELDPAAFDASGSHALAQLLADRGIIVERTTDPAAAARRAGAQDLLVLTRPYLLPEEALRQAVASGADLLVVEPEPETLEILGEALGVPLAYADAFGSDVAAPGCDLLAAATAGAAETGDWLIEVPPEATGCYGTSEGSALVQVEDEVRTVTLLASGAPLTNARLAHQGNAALGLGLLSTRSTVIWLTPRALATAGDQVPDFISLIPRSVKLATVQLGVAVVLLALWRARRLGPLVPERLPVVVPAAEVVAGRGRLYRRMRARDRAASALRARAVATLAPGLGLAADGPPAALIDKIATATRRTPETVRTLLYGAHPVDDAALVQLAADLDALAKEVHRS